MHLDMHREGSFVISTVPNLYNLFALMAAGMLGADGLFVGLVLLYAIATVFQLYHGGYIMYRHWHGDMIEKVKIIRRVYDSEASPVMSVAGSNQRPTRGQPYKLFNRRTKTHCRKLFFTERFTNVWNSLPNYIVEAPSIEAFERTIDRYWRDQYIVYNYEAAVSLGHSDWDGNDISPASSDNDMDIQIE